VLGHDATTHTLPNQGKTTVNKPRRTGLGLCSSYTSSCEADPSLGNTAAGRSSLTNVSRDMSDAAFLPVTDTSNKRGGQVRSLTPSHLSPFTTRPHLTDQIVQGASSNYSSLRVLP
jgi:hypothetical protein